MVDAVVMRERLMNIFLCVEFPTCLVITLLFCSCFPNVVFLCCVRYTSSLASVVFVRIGKG